MPTFENNIKVTRSKTVQKFNLRELLGRAATEEEKSEFARKAINLINERTLDGIDINKSQFTRYSEAYADKKGVSRDSVDMFLEGDMLGSIKTLRQGRDVIEIGIDESEQALKSHGHNTGGGRLPQRRFFGVTRQEALDLLSDFTQEDQDQGTGMTLAQLRAAVANIGLERDDG